MSNLITRTLAGAVFAALIIGSIIWHPLAVLGVFFIFNAIALFEFSRMFQQKGYNIPAASLIFLGSAVYLLIALFAKRDLDATALLLIIPLLFTLFMASLYKIDEKPFETLGIKVLAIIYISIPFALFNMVENMGLMNSYENEPLFLIGFFLLVWSSDTFAYLSGITFGKHRLFERISPKKSWEGSIGGAIATMIIAYFFGVYTQIFDPITWVIIALLTVITATFGDLIESQLKRSMGVKDSGNIMPGHGGILDRFDAAIFSIPFYVFLLYLLA
ncbi:MAG: phosphatidate cytidylyltransferase [Bacteroidetes bacterium 4572_77]|nr:MAG: phosphatidate cytidylyltransferase [Bacteroidetes bacterium 4572_77]